MITLIEQQERYNYIVLYLVIPFLLLVYFYQSALDHQINDFFICFRNVVIILAIISVFFWLGSSFGLQPNTSAMVNWGSNSVIPGYFNLHFIAQGRIAFLGFNLIRNTGMFVEAPMYAYVLCIALLITLFLDKRISKYDWKIFVLLGTIITTTSTTGLIVALIAFSYYLLVINKVRNQFFKLLIYLFIIIAMILAVLYFLTKKVDSDWASSSSIRMNDYVSGFRAWIQHPFIGNGLGSYSDIMKYMDYRRIQAEATINGMTGFSNGIMEVLAYTGLIGLLYYLVPTLIGFFHDRKLAAFSTLTFLLFCVTLIHNTYLYDLILCYLAMSRFDKNIEN